MPDFNVIKIGCIVVVLLVLLIAAGIIKGKREKRTIRKLKQVWRKETEWIREKLQQKLHRRKKRSRI